ncbi:hypothetical protein CKO15_13430 [Halorhodospira abdelmalekii]|uniref:hypothetical protein n=1 Tax=Halorhodospira abdelmalekii TaxID=421629 RepID=UPI001903467A|nr:hypothetical protein [Halorhodospira abdelmalekii]MBK1736245.1 hypothetical protein [Halorhodospira abdelmalekii]
MVEKAQTERENRAEHVLQWLTDVVNGTVTNPKLDIMGPTRHAQLRMPMGDYVKVQAICDKTGMNFTNAMMAVLIVGLEQLEAQLDEETHEKLRARQVEMIRKMFPGVV